MQCLFFPLCTHSVCKNCLVAHLATLTLGDEHKSKYYVCPHCPTSKIEKAEFLKNRLKPSLASTISPIDQCGDIGVHQTCELCQINVASEWCEECGTCTCADCDEITHRFKSNLHHLRGSIPAKTSKRPLADHSTMCSIHKDYPLDLYCISDGSVICYYCSRFGDHKGHACCLLSSKVKEQRQSLQIGANNLRYEMDGVTSLAQQTSKCLNDIVGEEFAAQTSLTNNRDSSYGNHKPSFAQVHSAHHMPDVSSRNRAKRQINTTFDAMVNLINKRREDLLSQIDDMADRKVAALKQQLDPLLELMAESSRLVDKIEELLLPPSHHDISPPLSMSIVPQQSTFRRSNEMSIRELSSGTSYAMSMTKGDIRQQPSSNTLEDIRLCTNFLTLKQDLDTFMKRAKDTYLLPEHHSHQQEQYYSGGETTADRLVTPVCDASMQLSLESCLTTPSQVYDMVSLNSPLPVSFVNFIGGFGKIAGPSPPIDVACKLIHSRDFLLDVSWKHSFVAPAFMSPISSFTIYCTIDTPASADFIFKLIEIGRLDASGSGSDWSCVVDTSNYRGMKLFIYAVAINETGCVSPISGDFPEAVVMVPDPSYVELPYDNVPFDRGLFSWIGTNGYTETYVNPHKANKVVVSYSNVGVSGGGSALYKFVGRVADGYNCAGPGINAWMCVDLGCGSRMVVSGYCLRQDQHGTNALRNWSLQGKDDIDSVWVELKSHQDDQTLSAKLHSTAYWPVLNKHTTASYRYFRIVQQGPNSSNKNWLMCCGMELYGTLIVD